jgi:hypothetical protein
MSGFSVLVKNSTKVDGTLLLHVAGKPQPQTTPFPSGIMYCYAVEGADTAEVEANFGDGSTGPYKVHESTTLNTTAQDGKYVFTKELARQA